MSPAARRDLDSGDRLVFDEGGEPLSPEARKLTGLGPRSPPPGKRWVDVLDVELDELALVDAYLARREHRHLRGAGAWWSHRAECLEKLLRRLREALRPAILVPIHTADPQRYASAFEEVSNRADGAGWKV